MSVLFRLSTSNRRGQSATPAGSHRPLAGGASASRFHRAFTLVELMVVVVIIGILASLLSVAVYNAVVKAKQAAVKLEIDQLDMAMKRYSTDRSGAPPCMAAKPASTRGALCVAHLRRAFPRFVIADYAALKTHLVTNLGQTIYGADINLDDLDQAEALVFWLGGPPRTKNVTSSTKLVGFSANVSNPFDPRGSRLPALFEFDETRLVDIDQDGWPEYQPNFKTASGTTPPYVYFDYATINSGDWWSYPIIPNQQSNANTYPKKTPSSLYSDWGVLMPYIETFVPKNPPTVPKSIATFVNPKSYQIISAGADSVYTTELFQGPGGLDKFSFFPSGVNYQPGENDNLTNFSDAQLGDKIP